MSLVGVGLTPVLVPLCHTPSMIVIGVRLTIHLVRSLYRHWVLVICYESDQLFFASFCNSGKLRVLLFVGEVIDLLLLVYICVLLLCMNLN